MAVSIWLVAHFFDCVGEGRNAGIRHAQMSTKAAQNLFSGILIKMFRLAGFGPVPAVARKDFTDNLRGSNLPLPSMT